MGFGEICLEVLYHIFSFLSSTRDLCRCSAVCRRWRDALDEREGSPIWSQALADRSLSAFQNSSLVKAFGGSRAKLVAFENAWNGEDCSPNIHLLEDELTLLRKPIAQSTDAIRGKCSYLHGQHYWTVTWHRPKFGSNAVIGVATGNEHLHREGYCGLLGSSCESWGWDISHGVLKYDGREIAKYPETHTEVRRKSC